jgi:Polyprenyl synthetase
MRLLPPPAVPSSAVRPDAVQPAGGFIASWAGGVRERARVVLDDFVPARCDLYVRGVPGADLVTELLAGSVSGGKYVRTTFTYLGWLCGAEESEAALRAAASTELLHAFALIQDDVMDRSVMRRGRTAAHVRLAGCGTVPGVGVPTVLVSGRLAADRITGESKSRRARTGAARPWSAPVTAQAGQHPDRQPRAGVS